MKIYEIISERLTPTNDITTNIKKSMASQKGSFKVPVSNMDNQYATLVGPKSTSWNKNSNVNARQLKKDGKNAQEIWTSTGNVIGPDGFWRQEVDDSGAKLTKDYLNTKTLGKGLDHKKLYKAYPKLKKYGLDPHWDNSKKPSVAGSFSATHKLGLSGWKPHTGDFKLGQKSILDPSGKGLANKKKKTGVISHEIQHGVDDIEGFAPGGSGSSDITKKLAKDNNMSDFDFYQTYAGELMGRENARRWNMPPDIRKKIVPTFGDTNIITTPDGKGGYKITPNHWNSDVKKNMKVKTPNIKPIKRPVVNTPVVKTPIIKPIIRPMD